MPHARADWRIVAAGTSDHAGEASVDSEDSKSMEPLRLELEYPSGHLHGALQRSAEMVALGLQAAVRLEVEELSIPGSFGQIAPARNRQLTIEQARDEFSAWILANGLRDCVEAIGSTMEWARKHCVLWAQPGEIERTAEGALRLSAQFSGDVWNREIVAGAEKFDRLPLPNKFQHLQEQYALAPPELADDILSLNAARNCLAHRLGVVGRKDLKNPTDQALYVMWRKPEVRVIGPAGERLVSGPTRVEAGEVVKFGVIAVSRAFPLGHRVQLSASDYVEIVATFMLFGQQLESNILRLQQRRYDEQEAKKT